MKYDIVKELEPKELVKEYGFFHDSLIEKNTKKKDNHLTIYFRLMIPPGGSINTFPKCKLIIKDFDNIEIDKIFIKNSPEFDNGLIKKDFFEFQITEYLGDPSKYKSIKLFGKNTNFIYYEKKS